MPAGGSVFMPATGRPQGGSGRLRAEAGFTLIELLVTMLLSLVVIGGGVYGISRAFQVSNASTDRVTASRTAEVGLEALMANLRDAIPGGCSYDGSSLSGISVALAANLTTLQFCGPNTNEAGPGNNPATEGIQWQCNTADSAGGLPAQTCERTVDTGTQNAPDLAVTATIAGVASFALTGILSTGSTPASSSPVYLPCDSPAACTANASQVYGLAPGANPAVSWMGIDVSITQLTTPGAGSVTPSAASTALPFRTGAALQNFGTS